MITARANFIRNGVNGTLADVTLVAEKEGHRVVQTVTTDAVNDNSPQPAHENAA